MSSTEVIPVGARCSVVLLTTDGMPVYTYTCPYWSRPCVDMDTKVVFKRPVMGHCVLLKLNSTLLAKRNKLCGLNLGKRRNSYAI